MIPRRVSHQLAYLSRTQIRALSDAAATSPTQRTLRVAPWDGFKSMTHVLATARELEKRFGPLENLKVARDPENGKYRGYAWLTFREPLPLTAAGEIPPEHQNIVVKKPSNNVDRPGGPGLDDFAGLLDAQHKTPENEWAKLPPLEDAASAEEYLDVRVEINKRELLDPPRRGRDHTPELQKAIARGFDEFTGFAEEPTPAMMEVWKKWSKHLSPVRTIPSSVQEGQEIKQKKAEDQKVEEAKALETDKGAVAESHEVEIDPLADYLKVVESERAEQLGNSSNMLPPKSSELTSHLQSGSSQVTGDVVSGQERQPDHKATQVIDFATISASQEIQKSESAAQGESNPVQKNATKPKKAGHRKTAPPAKPSKREALLAAARNAGKNAREEETARSKAVPQNNTVAPSEASETKAAPQPEPEPSTGLQSRIFSLFNRS